MSTDKKMVKAVFIPTCPALDRSYFDDLPDDMKEMYTSTSAKRISRLAGIGGIDMVNGVIKEGDKGIVVDWVMEVDGKHVNITDININVYGKAEYMTLPAYLKLDYFNSIKEDGVKMNVWI
jgi:hypothetical protein